jgi:hypothetical protein
MIYSQLCLTYCTYLYTVAYNNLIVTIRHKRHVICKTHLESNFPNMLTMTIKWSNKHFEWFTSSTISTLQMHLCITKQVTLLQIGLV